MLLGGTGTGVLAGLLTAASVGRASGYWTGGFYRLLSEEFADQTVRGVGLGPGAAAIALAAGFSQMVCRLGERLTQSSFRRSRSASVKGGGVALAPPGSEALAEASQLPWQLLGQVVLFDWILAEVVQLSLIAT